MFIWWPLQYIRPTRAQVRSTYTCYCQGNIKGQKERRRRWRTREGKTFCVCCNPTWPMHKQKKIKQFLHHIYILPSAHPPYTQYMQHCPAGAFVHPNNPDETLKKQKKKRTAPYHSYTSSWLLSSMSVVWRDSWFMSNSHQSCSKMLA